MATIRQKYDNVPLDKVKDKESRFARNRAQEIEDIEILEAFRKYRQIRAERLEKQNRKRLKENEYLV